jgi:hypothetical protein
MAASDEGARQAARADEAEQRCFNVEESLRTVRAQAAHLTAELEVRSEEAIVARARAEKTDSEMQLVWIPQISRRHMITLSHLQ